MRQRIKGDRTQKRAPSKTGDVLAGIVEGASHQTGLPPVPKMSKGFERIAANLFDQGYDVVKEFEDIQNALTIRDALSPAHVKAAANKSEDVAAKGMRLLVVAKVEYAKYTHRTDTLVGAMRDGATTNLEKLKAKGGLTKQITNDDVSFSAAQLYPDEWDDVHMRKVRAKEMLRYIERLADLSKSRSFTLGKMLGDDKGQ